MWGPAVHGEWQKVHSRSSRNYEQGGQVSAVGLGRSCQQKQPPQGERKQVVMEEAGWAGQAHIRSLSVVLGVGNLRQISPKVEKNPWLQDNGLTGKTSWVAVYWENILKAGQGWNKTPTSLGCAESFALVRNPCDRFKGYLWCKFSFSTPAKQHKINCKTHVSRSGQGCEILSLSAIWTPWSFVAQSVCLIILTNNSVHESISR